MFGISFGEILFICLVGILVLKPGDIKKLYVQVRHWIDMINSETADLKNIIKQIADEEFINNKIYNVEEAISVDVSRNNNKLNNDDTK